MAETKVLGICGYHCNPGGCFFQATIKDGEIDRLSPFPDKRFRVGACARIWTLKERQYHPDRLLYPLRRGGERGEGKWQRLSWDEALEEVARGLNRIKEKYGNEAFCLYHYESNFPAPNGMNGIASNIYRLLGLWGGFVPAYARGSLCWRSRILAETYLFGTTAVIGPEVAEAGLVVVWAWNPAISDAGREFHSLLRAREHGVKFTVIDPEFTRTAAVLADDYIPVHPATDTALALGLIHILLQERLFDRDFVLQHTTAPFLVRDDNRQLLGEQDIRAGGSDKALVWDTLSYKPVPVDTPGIAPALEGSYSSQGIPCRTAWQVLTDITREWTPERTSQVTGAPREAILKLARDFGTRVGIIPHVAPAYGRASWGENATYAVGILRSITGHLKGVAAAASTDPGGGAFGDMGLLKTAYQTYRVRNPVKVRFPVNRFAEAILNPQTYETNIKGVFITLGNPVNQSPNSNKVIEAMKALEFSVVCDTFLTATARYADIVLPATLGLERPAVHEYTTLEEPPRSYLIYVPKATEAQGEARDDVEIVAGLAQKLGLEEHFPWRDSDGWIRHMLETAKKNQAFPWLQEVTWERLKAEKMVEIKLPPQPHRQATWNLKTPSGRIEIYNEALLNMGYDPIPIYRPPEESTEATPDLYSRYPLTLTSPKGPFWTNSSMANTPTLLEIGDPEVLMSPEDAAARGIKDGDRVVVFNDRGETRVKATISPRIKPGVVRMYQGSWPEHGSPNLVNTDNPTAYGETAVYPCLVEVKRVE